jgi:Glycosyltransferase family 28 C-terminal domain
MKQLSICISPLDWGLGHATRCIPIIHALQEQGHTIYIATEGHHEVILKEAFPDARFLPLRGYHVRYAKKRSLFFVTIFLQAPKVLWSIINEYWWLKKMQQRYKFDLIIADNRIGFYHKNVPSVFITHQLYMIMPFNWASALFQKLQYAWIKRFSACWVPDMQGPNNLSGKLGNPTKQSSIPVWYMGCLSRLHQTVQNTTYNTNAVPIHFLGIVSGPEPQRTILENLLWDAGNQLGHPFVVVAGLPKNEQYHKATQIGTLYHHLSGPALAKQISNADYVICRGGYTSLMELIPFGKKLIIIPTPGQTEQEYLGTYWQENNWAICIPQNEFNLATVLLKAKQFNFTMPPFSEINNESLASQLKQLTL